MKSDPISQRVQELVDEQDVRRTRELAWQLANDLGAELPQRKLGLLRTYEQAASSALRRLEVERPESFICGFLFATLHVCDAYDAQIAPDLEAEAIREAKQRRTASGR